MTKREPPGTDQECIDAAKWLVAIDEGLSPGQSALLQAWLDEKRERGDLLWQQAALGQLAIRLDERRDRHRRPVRAGLTLAAAACLALAVVIVAQSLAPSPVQQYQTQRGEIRTIELEDGSQLWLDASTVVEVAFEADRRRVEMESGRLFVSVSDNPTRPFEVATGRFTVRAVGTAFEVTEFQRRAGVAVSEGVVELQIPMSDTSHTLSAGQSAFLFPDGSIGPDARPVSGFASWRNERMVLVDMPLRDAVSELNRYFERPLRIGDDGLGARRISASFSLGDLDTLSLGELVAESIGGRALEQEDRSVLLVAQEE